MLQKNKNKIGYGIFLVLILTGALSLKLNAKPVNKSPGFLKSEIVTKILVTDVYVTSVKQPENKFGYRNLFDGNMTTSWQTMQGAGPEEGIMLYFSEKQDFDKIEIWQNEASRNSDIKDFKVYINGYLNSVKISRETDKLILHNISGAKSLFLKVASTLKSNQSTKQTKFIQLENGYESMRTVINQKDEQIAIAELKFFQNNAEVELMLPQLIKAQISASSTLSPKASYGVDHLFDGKKDFAWVEGVPGNGFGQTIDIVFEKPQKISGLIITNGFQRSSKHYTSNARAKTISIIDDKENSQQIQLDDEMSKSDIHLAQEITTKTLQIRIDDVYNGSRYQDLVISELAPYNSKGTLKLQHGIVDDRKEMLLNATENSPLGNLLDRRITQYWEGEMEFSDQTLIIRSDNTFVYYKNSEIDDTYNQIVAYGNWELKSTDGSNIRIFGRLRTVSENYSPYQGNDSSNSEQIFQDYLTITKSRIGGQKFIGALEIPDQQ